MKLSLARARHKHIKHHKYPLEKRIEVVTKWLALGNLRLVADLSGVDYGLIRNWRMEDWWKDLEAEIKHSRDVVVDNKLQKLVDRSLESIADRLENGDVWLNRKTGETHRVEAPLKDLVKAADTLMNQQTLLAKKEQQETAAQVSQSVQDQIKMLAQEFAKFNSGRTIDVQAKEIHAVHDQREAGLQEAVREVRRETGEYSEEVERQQGSPDHGEGGEGVEGGWEGRGSPDSPEQGWDDDEEQPEGGEPDDQSFFFTQP